MRTRFRIRTGRAGDAAVLTGLAMRSKAHWGYDADFMELCRPELTITAARIAEEEVVVAETEDGAIAGFGSYGVEPDGSAEILNCFVEPARIGAGIGRAIMAELLDRARDAGIAVVMVDSDPQAEGFYRRAGFIRVGDAASGSIPGRRLPRLRHDLE